MSTRFSPDTPVRGQRGLEETLASRVLGEVRFDAGSRALYATDGSNYRQVPIGVVLPRDVEDVIATVSVCRQFGVPLLPRGCGTSLAGQCCNTAVVIDFSKYLNQILEVDPVSRRARVQPGVVLDALRDRAEMHHLTFGPDPSTHNHCTLGGMIGNDSCGVHSVMAGRTSDNVEELDVLLYDGTSLRVGATPDDVFARILGAGGRAASIYRALAALRDRYAGLIRERFPKIPRRVSGYSLDALLPENGFNIARALVGTEGTCVTVLAATLRLVPSPPSRSLVVLGYADIFAAGDHVPEIMAHGPIGLEGLDEGLIADMKRKHLHPKDASLLPPGGGWLLVEFGGESKEEADAHARRLMQALRKTGQPPSMKLFDDPAEEHHVWLIRESGLGATAVVPGAAPTWEGWEDSAVPPKAVGAYLRDLRALLDRYGYRGDLYGHLGQGCIHTRINFDLETAPGIKKFRSFLEAAADLVVSYGGSLSGEHGDGQARGELLTKMFGPELVQAFAEFKAIWDPDGRMNPGKVVNPYRVDQHLRLGATYRPPSLATEFKYPDDNHSFASATLRCVGVGNCRRMQGGTMCPSYRVTRDERHSTRGRARLLFEMLQGDPLKRGWREPAVREALDLCLACKGCKGDCPVNVDMATYKAEFLAHYYAGRLRPRSAYAFGLIHEWSRLAALAPRLVNLFTEGAFFRGITRWLTGMTPNRSAPRYAPQTFKRWFHQREPARKSGPVVVLWPDTFNNHFHPEIARAAVTVLETLGYQVRVPRAFVCCGRPLYDFGMIERARALARRNLTVLADEILAGTPIIGLEPSCTAVFRDELLNLFPDDEQVARLSRQFFTLAEFIRRFAGDRALPCLARRALVQVHCHHRAIMKPDADEKLLGRLGLDFELLDAGCCGLAGAFGFEREHYDLSMQIGEHAVLPACRAAAADELIIADGFSCRTQIEHATGRRALHTAELLDLAFAQASPGNAGASSPRRRIREPVSLSFGG
ncbi:MAG: FAD-binding and (Fe-S)-binding domain-containing protein [Acidiferrobacteraceae bacterium]